MYALALLLSVLALLPLFLYLVGVIRDPFHPFIMIGVLFFGIAGKPILFNSNGYLQLLREEFYSAYLIQGVLAILAVYFGWYLAGRSKKWELSVPQSVELDPAKLLRIGFVFSLIGVVAFVLTYEDWSATGYVRDLGMLWITGSILICQAIILTKDGNLRLWCIAALPVAFFPPLDRFLVYGQRGDTFRVLAVLSIFFLMTGRRPSRPVFFGFIIVASVVLSTLQMTRSIVTEGQAPNRFAAILQVWPKFFEAEKTVDPSEEIVFGAAGMSAVRETGRYGFGRGLTLAFIQRFAPKELFPNKWSWFPVHAGYDVNAIRGATGVTISRGSAPSGVAHAFFELGWLAPLVWIILGYFCRHFWMRMELRRDIPSYGYFVSVLVVLLYAIAQDIFTAQMNFLYTFVPLYFAYRLAKVVPAESLAGSPAGFEVVRDGYQQAGT